MDQLTQQVELENQQYLLQLAKTEFVKFSDISPEYPGSYEVCIDGEHGKYVECAEYNKSRNIFVFYSRRGFPYEIKVTHWKELPPLPLMEKHDV